ncbi:dTDP-4-dehydrorhamnose reductase [Candidatus Saganbacteria bacterium]|nr:dTDP-4-dehydrorhamnose reductase [Candidatus Saganbacteria bacterium]
MMLVTGANGMVGSYVPQVFKGEDFILTDLPEMDVTNRVKVFGLIGEYKPDIVLHLAAETDVDKCEKEIDHAFRVNAIGTQNVALACQKYKAVLVYISTGGVFDGLARQVHTEYDQPAPLNIYSKAKYAGELVVKDLLREYYIFRAGWMIGGGEAKDKKFVGKIIELCKTCKEIEAVDDKFGNPTFANDFVSGIKKIIQTGNYGLYHLVNTGVCSRYEIAVEIVKILGVDVMVKPVSSDRFPLPAPRSASEAMSNFKLDLMGINPMRDWKQALANYVSEWRESRNFRL